MLATRIECQKLKAKGRGKILENQQSENSLTLAHFEFPQWKGSILDRVCMQKSRLQFAKRAALVKTGPTQSKQIQELRRHSKMNEKEAQAPGRVATGLNLFLWLGWAWTCKVSAPDRRHENLPLVQAKQAIGEWGGLELRQIKTTLFLH